MCFQLTLYRDARESQLHRIDGAMPLAAGAWGDGIWTSSLLPSTPSGGGAGLPRLASKFLSTAFPFAEDASCISISRDSGGGKEPPRRDWSYDHAGLPNM